MEEDLIHVMPTNDIYPHHSSITCPCNPQRDVDEQKVILHNAFDGRDFKELIDKNLADAKKLAAELDEAMKFDPALLNIPFDI